MPFISKAGIKVAMRHFSAKVDMLNKKAVTIEIENRTYLLERKILILSPRYDKERGLSRCKIRDHATPTDYIQD